METTFHSKAAWEWREDAARKEAASGQSGWMRRKGEQSRSRAERARSMRLAGWRFGEERGW